MQAAAARRLPAGSLPAGGLQWKQTTLHLPLGGKSGPVWGAQLPTIFRIRNENTLVTATLVKTGGLDVEVWLAFVILSGIVNIGGMPVSGVWFCLLLFE